MLHIHNVDSEKPKFQEPVSAQCVIEKKTESIFWIKTGRTGVTVTATCKNRANHTAQRDLVSPWLEVFVYDLKIRKRFSGTALIQGNEKGCCT